MKRASQVIFVLLFLSMSCSNYAQENFILNKDATKRIDFELINNLIIIPIEINGTSLSFILDTGVSKPILFNLSEQDSVDINETEKIFLHGLGPNGKIEALRSKNNVFQFGEAKCNNLDLYVVFDDDLNFTPRLGIVVHGIIGYDIFKDFIVEINYSSEYIKLYNHEAFNKKMNKKWQKLPLEINKTKPYIDTYVTMQDTLARIPVKLLIDSGSSDALWLFEDSSKGLVPDTSLFFRDYLGKGLSGSVYGKRSRINKLTLNKFEINDANVAFPDTASVDVARIFKERDGSLGGNVLKRFNYFFDYKNEQLYIKKNNLFNKPFLYNNSGITLEHNGAMFVREKVSLIKSNNNPNENLNTIKIDFSLNYIMSLKPVYRVVELRESSNAFKAGLKVGDILIRINGNPAYNYDLSKINEILYGNTGKSIRLRIERNGIPINFKFKLDDVFQKNELPN
ncbi:MAG: signaling protein [Winogradskyella sp.]|uniref:aspartyl protease family protein n=1 Tax=Winogradskyella sp. TaxID=1883156 RepID=UPI0017C181FE|nr:signaling protein [Winogradskyella sp.]